MKRFLLSTITAAVVSLITTSALAEINRVRVVNKSNAPIYVHVGGYAPSTRLNPGEWKIYYYPFMASNPEKMDSKIKTSLLVATAGGKWITTQEGYTILTNPQMTICLDYKSPEYADKTGNRVWVIKQAMGFDKGCQVKAYKQPVLKGRP